MAYHVQLTQPDITHIANQYGLPITHFTPMEGGHGNTSYQLEAKGAAYVLTLLETQSLAVTEQLARLLQRLAAHNFQTTQVVPTQTGALAIMCQGRSVLLKRFITGTVHQALSDHLLHRLGGELAKLHQIPAPNFLPRQHGYGMQQFSSVFEAGIDEAYEGWLAKQLGVLERGIPAGLKTSLIHGDLFYDNVLITPHQQPIIIDFEQACHYYLGFDLGMAIVGLCQTDEHIDLPKAKAFMAGYQQANPIPERERAMIQLFTQYAAIATSYWRFWAFNIHTPMPSQARRCWQMVQIAEQVQGMEQTNFRESISI